VNTRHTQPFMMSRRTEPATRATIDPRDTLNAAVMAYNVRQGGRDYAFGETGDLFDAVKQFNARRQAARAHY
jgi:hypothetical protein